MAAKKKGDFDQWKRAEVGSDKRRMPRASPTAAPAISRMRDLAGDRGPVGIPARIAHPEQSKQQG
jgi:hypothetical protein